MQKGQEGNDMEVNQIGMFIKALRKEKKLTQEQLADALFVSSKTVSRWETGRNLPDLLQLRELADYFQVDVRELIDGKRFPQQRQENSGEEKERERDMLKKMTEYSVKKEKKISQKMWLIFSLILLVIAAAIAGLLLKQRKDDLDEVRTDYVSGRVTQIREREDGNIDLYLLCENVRVLRFVITGDVRMTDDLAGRLTNFSQDEPMTLSVCYTYTRREEKEAAKKGETVAYHADIIGLADLVPDYWGAAPAPAYSGQLSKDLKNDWEDWNSKDLAAQALESRLPGHLWKYFDSWEDAEAYAGVKVWNPFEGADWLSRKNTAGTDIITEPETKLQHSVLNWSGKRDGNVSHVSFTAGYADESVRVIYTAELQTRHSVYDRSAAETLSLSDSVPADVVRNTGDLYQAICLYFRTDDVFCSVQILSSGAATDAAFEKIVLLLKEALSGQK